MSKQLLAILLSTPAVLLSAPASAQTAGRMPAEPATPAVDSDKQTDQSGSDMPDIIVTAQKRSERLVDVPITITAVDGARLERAGVTSLSGLQEVVPALRFDNSGSYGQLSIRGVGTSLTGPAVGSAVGTYVDGFLKANPLNTDFDLLNVTNVQVLKGPQGTLFGRNTTAGAVLVTTSDPSQDTSVRGRISYARFDTLDLAGYATTGITDRIAVDIAAKYDRTNGFVRNIFDGNNKVAKRKSLTLRAGLKFDLGGDNSILIRYQYEDIDDPSVSAYGMYKGIGLAPLIAPALPIAQTRGIVSIDDQPTSSTKSNAGFLTGKFDLGFANLTSYTMYQDQKSFDDIDFDGSSLAIFHLNAQFRDKVFTQEVNLNSKPSSPINWVVGAFYFHHDSSLPAFNASVFGSPFATILRTGNTVSSYAAFADATYEVLPNLFLTGGLRYSHENDKAYYELPSVNPAQPFDRFPGEANWRNLTPRAVLRYQIDPSSNVYASFTKGFKAGFIDVNGQTTTPVKSEEITSFEAGYKVSRGTVSFNLSAFRYSYKNLQIVTELGVRTLTTNAARSTLYGGEANLDVRVTDRLEVALAGAYTHSKYDSYTSAPVFTQVTDPADPSYGTLATGSIDASGFQMARAPEFSGNAAVTYTAPLAGGKLVLNGNFAYQSLFYFDPAHQFPQKAYGLLNLRATWNSPSDKWSLSVFGNNVTDVTYRRSVFGGPFAVLETYGTPATYGAELAFHF